MFELFKGKGRPVVKCDYCGQILAIKPRKVRRGELEYQYIICRKCKEPFVFSVTDKALRESIAGAMTKAAEGLALNDLDYLETAQTEYKKKLKEIIDQNTTRSRELKEKHPLKLHIWEK